MRNYDILKKTYPEYISLDQFYRICKIAKRSAAYLLQNGIVPSIDTGKRTWRYQIKIDDVITYLKKRDKVGTMIPRGVVTSRKKTEKNIQRPAFSIATTINIKELTKYFESVYADQPDALTTKEASKMAGTCKETIRRKIKAGKIKSMFLNNRHIICKDDLIEFLTSEEYIEDNSNSDHFRKILSDYELWK
ncbi:MAG: helix-turn-helix domain-containing protein [Clostridiaceae bacterium]|nr:helix-turn-helix domain-containing protein [Clostridiaceae bacterium]